MAWGHGFRRVRGAAVVAIVLLAGCAWPQFQQNAAHTGNNPFETAIGVGTVAGLHEVWTAASGEVSSTPVVTDGMVYVGTLTNRVFAYDAFGSKGCTGTPKVCTPRWQSGNLAGAIVGSPAVENGIVYVAGIGERLFAFDAKGTDCDTRTRVPTCAPLWTATLNGEVRSAPTVANGVVYVNAAVGDQVLFAFDAAGSTGCSGAPKVCTPLWTASLPISGTTGADTSAPAVAGGRVFVSAHQGGEVSLAAYDAAGTVGCSGVPKVCTPLWAGEGDSSPSVDRGVVYSTGDGGLLAYDAAGTGCPAAPDPCAPLWQTSPADQDPVENSGQPIAKGIVYSGSFGGIAAYDATGGAGCSGVPKVCTPLWTTPVGGDTAGAIANGVLFATDANGISAVDAGGTVSCTGAPKVCQPLWSAPGGFRGSSPSVVNGLVYVGSSDGRLHVFGLA